MDINQKVIIKDTGKVGVISQLGTKRGMYHVVVEQGDGEWYAEDELEKYEPKIVSSGVCNIDLGFGLKLL